MMLDPTIPTRPRRAAALVFLVATCCLAAEDEPRPPKGGLPGGIEVEADSLREVEGDVVLEGRVTLRWRGSRFQADRIVLREERFVEAVGNVLVVWGGSRVYGTRMTYDLVEERGVIENAMGRVEPEYNFTAERVEKVGEDLVYLDSANVTTCTQPVPYWSFSVSRARVRVDGYARLWNLRLKTGRAPTFYLPFMLWPVKRERSAGLLFPQVGGTRDRGQVVSQALFLPLGESADLTLVGEYYTRAGYGGGTQFRYLPNREGRIDFNGFFIMDEVVPNPVSAECTSLPCLRWRATYRQTQKFRNGFRMVADVNQVSDFEFFSDFERDLRLVSSPTILARVEFSRNGKWTSVNVRELRREQFVSGAVLVQQTLPELEWRGRSTRLGKSPFYLSFESSFASIQQQGRTIDADYLRGDVSPTLSLPVSPFPWLDVNPQASYRMTYYSQRRDPQNAARILDDGLLRGVGSAGLEIVGPKLSRIYGSGDDGTSPRYKHTVEPRIFYRYGQGFERDREIIEFDEVDRSGARASFLNYGIRSRFLMRRQRSEPEPPPESGEPIVMPDGETSPGAEMAGAGATGASPADEGAPPARSEPVEVASVEIGQSRNLDDDRPLSQADLDGDTVIDATSPRSSISLTGRLNPSRAVSFDLRSNYNILFHRIQDVSLSGNLRRSLFQFRFSLIHREGLGVRQQCLETDDQGQCTRLVFPEIEDSTQVRLNGGVSLWRGKLRLAVDGSFNANPQEGASRFPDRRLRVEYYTQCCGILAESLSRDFVDRTRRDFRVTVDLRGIGKFLDLHHGTDR